MNNTAVIIQARLTSSRFPKKVLKKVSSDQTVLDYLYLKLSSSKLISKIIFCIPDNKKNFELKNYLKKKNYLFFSGPENDVLKRYCLTAKKFNVKHIVRITCDCPLIDGEELDKHLKHYFTNKFDYLTNQINRTYPDGFDIEIIKSNLLNEVSKKSFLKEDREHVTTYLKRNLKKINSFNYIKDFSNLRLTLDYKEDLLLIKKIIKYFGNKKYNLSNIYNYLKKTKNIKVKKSIGQIKWNNAKEIMPPGSMLLSKNPDLFLKQNSPAYFFKSKGCYIWDLEKKKYIDFSYMGVGTNILGYSDKDVNLAVKKAIDNGTCSSLNSQEDLILANKIIEIHPWFDSARFGRGGAETNSIAIRLSRSYTQKKNIAICGYHGWHDWYLSANYKSKNLKNFLFDNVKTKGVLNEKSFNSQIFNFNNIKEFKSVVDKGNFACVIMEIKRNIEPNLEFLKYIRKYCSKNNVVLIFDECSSGFRECYGGYHKKIKIYPDLAMFSKAIGNGYPITILAGKSNILKESNETFVSSTYWSERVGPVAALATLNKMKKIKSWVQIRSKGKYIRNKLLKIANKNNIKLELNHSISIINFKIIGKYEHVIYRNFISQEMLKKNIMFTDTIYVSVAHTKKIINKVFDSLNEVFNKISLHEKKEDLFVQLEQDISGINFFKRIN